MKKIVLGTLAHVDAGKTTLSEAMLYESGKIMKQGRVDAGNAYLDHYELERKRGITIFSKQAMFSYNDMQVTLLDTPGHVDFSSQMEKTLKVMDYAILLVSGADGVQGHTYTLWKLLKQYKIPAFIFVNKMDQDGTAKDALMEHLKDKLNDNCICFDKPVESLLFENDFQEELAMCAEDMMEKYLKGNSITLEDVRKMIRERKMFPCFFGAALYNEGVKELLDAIEILSIEPTYTRDFGARVFKIIRDEQKNRVTFLKITGGSLRVREEMDGEKVTQIRRYSGEKYETTDCAYAGEICAVTGLNNSRIGSGYGREASVKESYLKPVLTYSVILPDEVDAVVALQKFRQLEEEDPELNLIFNEASQEIKVQVMGEIQMEILKHMVKERFGFDISFANGKILYKETISDIVEGVGHFEPLRHYAEVHLKLEPLPVGSGLVFESDCMEEELARNWQNLILTNLKEKEHVGVLTGSPITDMRISIVAGRAHLKHTEGGDFRQATYRAVRHGLMQATSVLLEPFYEYVLDVPDTMLGRAMTDIDKMGGTCESHVIENGHAKLTGTVPVRTLGDYQIELRSYTKGAGTLSLNVKGYYPCPQQAEIVEAIGYEAERDVQNTADSVFCAHGAGFVVPWYEVHEYMLLEPVLFDAEGKKQQENVFINANDALRERKEIVIGTEEIDEILARTYDANRGVRKGAHKGISARRREEQIAARTTRYYSENSEGASYHGTKKDKERNKYLLVDGYNILYAWEEFAELIKVNIDGARGKLLDILSDYQGSIDAKIIVVFDAYRVAGHKTELVKYHNIDVVYTKEAETADQYIEKFGHEHGKKHEVTVATSDGLEQIIIRGEGCLLMSARDLKNDVTHKQHMVKEKLNQQAVKLSQKPFDNVGEK